MSFRHHISQMESSMTFSESKNSIYPIYFFLKSYPKRSAITVFALFFSGLAEAISFAAMIPLLGMALLQDNTDKELGFLEEGILQIFEFSGLEMTIGSILFLVVFLMSLKSLLSFYAMREVGYICADVHCQNHRVFSV